MGHPDSDSADFSLARATLRKAQRKARHKVTDDLLRRVAHVYSLEEPHPAAAVEAAFGVWPRTAFRYISEARRRGYLAPRED